MKVEIKIKEYKFRKKLKGNVVWIIEERDEHKRYYYIMFKVNHGVAKNIDVLYRHTWNKNEALKLYENKINEIRQNNNG